MENPSEASLSLSLSAPAAVAAGASSSVILLLVGELLCEVGEYASLVGNFVNDFFADVEGVFTGIAALPAEIEAFFVGPVSDIETELIGLVTVVIRVWGGLPEGVMYAILLGNAVTPHLDQWFRPKVYGNKGRNVAS